MQLKPAYWSKIPLVLILFCGLQSSANDSLSIKQKRAIVIGGNSVAYSASMVGLYSLWYKDHPTTSFHFFNDNKEWGQMDKVGHAYSCYYEGVVGIQMMKWAGYNHQLSSILGGSYGFIIQSSIEVFDGFSDGWGASPGDMLSNIFGTALVVGQSLAWDEQRIWMKYSFSPTSYPDYRPNLLGSSVLEQIFKDYNGQTYWLSVNPSSFMRESNWPDWLNIAVGYGIDGFVGGHDNIFTTADGTTFDYTSEFPRIRQWYISPDIDLTRLKTNNKALRIGLTVLNSLKFPLPTLEYNKNDQFVFHPIKF
ncbi:MAG: DUF2279 domain-containing protein [Bacteroidia bacterium]